MILSAQAVREAAHACQFPLVGMTPAVPLDPQPLREWIARGYAAASTLGGSAAAADGVRRRCSVRAAVAHVEGGPTAEGS